jgi:hypothetical protein
MGRILAFNIRLFIALMLCACGTLAHADDKPSAPLGTAAIDLVDNRVQVQFCAPSVPGTLLLGTGGL